MWLFWGTNTKQTCDPQLTPKYTINCFAWNIVWSELKFILTYRPRQYDESKVLHQTEVSWFSKAYSWTYHFDKKNLTKCRSHIRYASFDTCKAKIGRFFISKSVFKVPWEINFWAIYTASQKHISTLLHTYVLNEFLTADCSCTTKYFWKDSSRSW